MRLLAFLALFTLGTLSHALVAMWAVRTFPSLEKRKRLIWGIAIALAMLAPAARILSRWTHGTLAPLYAEAVAQLTVHPPPLGHDVLHPPAAQSTLHLFAPQ